MGRGEGATATVDTTVRRHQGTETRRRRLGRSSGPVVFYGAVDVPAELTYPKGSLLVVGGVPGAGKSTLLARLTPDAVVLNADEFFRREPEKNRRGVRLTKLQRLGRASKAMQWEAGRQLRDGKTVIIDAPALMGHLQSAYQRMGWMGDTETHAIYVEATKSEARRGQWRRRRLIKRERQRNYLELWGMMRDELEAGDSLGFGSVTVLDRGASSGLQALRFE